MQFDSRQRCSIFVVQVLGSNLCGEGGGGSRWGKGERIDDSYDRPGRVDPKKKSPDFRSSLDFVIMHKTYICKMCSVQIVFIFRI